MAFKDRIDYRQNRDRPLVVDVSLAASFEDWGNFCRLSISGYEFDLILEFRICGKVAYI